MNKGNKTEVINCLAEDFSKYNCFYIVDTTGISVNKIRFLQRDCRDNKIVLKVSKNTLIRKAMKQVKYSEEIIKTFSENALKNMSMVMFVNENAGLPAKAIKKFNTLNSENNIVLKCAYIMGECYVGNECLDSLSRLKSKNEVIAEIIIGLKGGISKIVSGLLNRLEKNV